MFTPNFEVLEVMLTYVLLDVSAERATVLQRNAVITQSPVHGGRFGDTREEVTEWWDAWLKDRLTEIENLFPRDNIDRKMAVKKVRRFAEQRMKHAQRFYLDFDQRDPEGHGWLAGDGALLCDALLIGYRDAVRLLVNELEGASTSDVRERPPGYYRELQRLPALDDEAHVRRVYRLDDGALLSIDGRSRMVPF